MSFTPGEKVVLWGDSIGKGVIWNETRGRYGVIDTSAAQLAASALHITVVNRSRFGYTAPQGLTLMERDVKEGLSADAAVIEFGGNDCNFDWAAISESPEERHDPATQPGAFHEALYRMIKLLRERGIRPILMTLPPIDAQRYFRFLVGDRLNAKNILLWLGDVQRIYRFQELYSALAAESARELDVELLDIRARCLASVDFIKRGLCADGLHINEEGQRFIGAAVTELVLCSGASGVLC